MGTGFLVEGEGARGGRDIAPGVRWVWGVEVGLSPPVPVYVTKTPQRAEVGS